MLPIMTPFKIPSSPKTLFQAQDQLRIIDIYSYVKHIYSIISVFILFNEY